MEPTGHCWKAFANWLEKQGGIKVALVNPYATKQAKELDDNSQTKFDRTVRLRLTSSQVTVMDNGLHEIVYHRCLYGEKREGMDWIPYLRYIARKPCSLRNSGIYGMMPKSMQTYLDGCESSERGRILKVLAELTERSGFDSALNTINEAIRYKAMDPASLQNLYTAVHIWMFHRASHECAERNFCDEGHLFS